METTSEGLFFPHQNDSDIEMLNSSNVNYLTNNYIPYHLRLETYLVPLIFSVIFIVGILGNGTLVVIFILNRNLRNIPNTYILSLALGDLCVLCLSMPFVSAIYVLDSWPFGLFICRFSEFFRNVSIGVTVFTLTALSGDRYLAIASPFRSAKKHGSTTVAIAIGIWFLAIVLSLPDALTSILLEMPVSSGEVIYICYPFPEWLPPWYKKANILGKALIFYAVPLTVIGSFYMLMARSLLAASHDMPGELRGVQKQIKTRKKVAKIVLCFVCIFAFCFLPNHIFLLWFYFDPNSKKNYNDFWHALRPIGFTLSFVNSCVNPLALYFISGLFRKYFNQYLLSQICCCKYFQVTDIHNQLISVTLASTAGRCNFHSSMAMTKRPTNETVVMTTTNHNKNGRTSF